MPRVWVFGVCWAVTATAAAQPGSLPAFGNDPYGLLGLTIGSRALTIDPAGLAFGEGGDCTYLALHQGEWTSHQLGGAWHLGDMVGMGVAGELQYAPGQPSYGRLSAGLAVRFLDGLALGLAYHGLISRSQRSLDGLGRWDASLTGRLDRWASLGIRIAGFNEAWVQGVAAPAMVSLGAGVRPLGSSAIVLGAQWDLVQGIPVTDPRTPPLHLTLGVEPIDGLHLLASLDVAAPQHSAQRVWAGIGLDITGLSLAASAGSGLGSARTGSDTLDAAFGLGLAFPHPASIVPPPPRYVHVALEGDLRPPHDRSLLQVAFGRDEVVPTVLQRLHEAASDPAVAGVVVTVRELHVGLATLEEVRSALGSVRAAGKQVIAILGEAGNKEYFVASAASTIRMDPISWLTLNGLHVRLFYVRDTLGKIGVRFDAVAIGQYKSAPEELVRSGPSEPALAMENELADALFGALLDGVADSRGLPVERVRQLLDRGVFSAREAREAGLVDELTYDPALPDDGGAGGSSIEPYGGPPTARDAWGTPPEIVVVPVQGTLVSQRDEQFLAGEVASAERIGAWLSELSKDSSVAAIVVRVDSGGGDIGASEYLWRAIRQARRAKPVIVSMGDTAASGAYYLACAATLIVADPSTITGSIGVFALYPDVSDLLDMVGVGVTTVERGAHAGLFDADHSRSPHELELLRRELTALYGIFVDRVAESRGLPRDEVERIAQGHVYTGTRARELHLVDTLGGLWEAVSAARAAAGLAPDANVRISYVEEQAPLMTRLAGAVQGESAVHIPATVAGVPWATLGWQLAVMGGRPWYVLPFVVTVE